MRPPCRTTEPVALCRGGDRVMGNSDNLLGLDCGAYRAGSSVRVRVPGDPRRGEVGRVDRTYNDCGDMVHVLEFPDGTRAEYDYSDLVSVKSTL